MTRFFTSFYLYRSKTIALLKQVQQKQPELAYLVIFTIAMFMLSVLGLMFDQRHISGELAWIKPCKFSISLMLYGATLIWLSGFLSSKKQLLKMVFKSALVGSVIELTAIIIQVIRGTTSHFNMATSLDTSLWYAIMLAIFPIAFAIIVVFVLLMMEENLPPVIGLTIKWATLIAIIGFIPGILMILPDPIQDVITAYKQFDGHTIGYPEGGPGLPWLGWSTIAGDLRVAHFVGIHALQVIPILGFVISKLCTKISMVRQKAIVTNFAMTYLGFQLLLTWQALHAESIIEPSERTILMALILLFVSLITLLTILFADESIPTISSYKTFPGMILNVVQRPFNKIAAWCLNLQSLL